MKETKFKQTEIGKILGEERVKTINELCEVTSSKRIFLSDYVNFGVPFYRSKEVIERAQGKEISELLFITREKFNQIKTRFGAPKKGDLLISSVGARSGIPWYVDKEGDFYFKDGNVIWFRNFSSDLISKYLYYFLESNSGQSKLKKFMIGSAQGALTIEGIKRIDLKIPPVLEQQAIASILSSLDAKIELNNKMNKTLEAIGQVIFKRWFVEEAKDEWKNSSIGKEFKTILGGTPDRTKPEYWNGNINWINSGKTNEFRITSPSEKITEEGLRRSATKILPKYTTVLAITGATLGQVSRLEIDTCANQSVVGIVENEKIPSEFIYSLIKERIGDIISHQTGGAQQHINKSNVDSFEFLLPDEKTLKEYKQLVGPIFQIISKNCFENQSLSQIRDLLLPKLMSGEIRVPIK